MEKQELEKLVELTNKLDAEGHTEEAAALDTVLIRLAEAEEEKGMSGKAKNALRMLYKTCKSFCSKNLDTRGSNRRKMSKICDMAEDLITEIEPLLDKEDKA
jgi:hypothetical protein